MGVRQLELRRRRHPDTLRHPESADRVSPGRSRRCARARTGRWPRPRTTTRARCTWTRSRARSASMPSQFRLHASRGRSHRGGAQGGRGEDRLAEGVRRRAVARSASPAEPKRADSSRPPRRSPGPPPASASSASSLRSSAARSSTPTGSSNQVEGSVVQGLGGALFEAIDFADGHIRNGSMAQYRVPRFKDVPVDRRDPARSPRSAVGRRRRGVVGLRGAGDRQRRPRLRQGRHGVAGPAADRLRWDRPTGATVALPRASVAPPSITC